MAGHSQHTAGVHPALHAVMSELDAGSCCRPAPDLLFTALDLLLLLGLFRLQAACAACAWNGSLRHAPCHALLPLLLWLG